MSKRGIRFVFQDLGDHGGSSAPAWIPGLNTYIKIIRVNRGTDKLIILHLYNTATGKWDVFDEFSQHAGDWDYNVGDVGIEAGWDGSLMITTNAGNGSGKNEIRDATAYYPASVTGWPTATGAPIQRVEMIDQSARDQLKAFSGAVTNAVTKATDAANAASDIKRTVKTEVTNAMKGVAIKAADIAVLVSQAGPVRDALWKLVGELIYAQLRDKTSPLINVIKQGGRVIE